MVEKRLTVEGRDADKIECLSISEGKEDEEEIESESSQLTPATIVIDLLKCPVCTNYMYPPIHQCQNGHTLCSTCKSEMHNRCPTCRQELGDIRCLALEKVADFLELPCRYFSSGCPEIFSYYMLPKHEGLCHFRQFGCTEPEKILSSQSSELDEKYGLGASSVSELLECPVCTNIMYPPIHQCSNGHTLCFTCVRRVHGQCPACRQGPQGLISIRCVTLELLAKSVKHPCKFSALGCELILPYYERSKHEISCSERTWEQIVSMDTPEVASHTGSTSVDGTAVDEVDFFPVADSITPILRCSSCSHIMSSTIHQCHNGHTFCSNCITKHRQCPECHVKISDIRCLALEKIVKVLAESSWKIGHTELYAVLCELLKCPICNCLIFPPIHQCRKGHTLCSVCKKTRKRCPICKCKLGDIRCVALEEVAEFVKARCKYHKILFGCHEILPTYKMVGHETTCSFRSVSCPYVESKCCVTGDVSFIAKHLECEHFKVMHKGFTRADRYAQASRFWTQLEAKLSEDTEELPHKEQTLQDQF